jgi:hypothetical protein
MQFGFQLVKEKIEPFFFLGCVVTKITFLMFKIGEDFDVLKFEIFIDQLGLEGPSR